MIRILLVAACVVAFALALAGMRRGWRQRARRQGALPPLPTPPRTRDLVPAADLAPALTGLYIGSTVGQSWQDRIVVHGLGERAEVTARLTPAGALLDRVGSGPLFIPAAQLIDARLEPALAGKVVGRGGLLVLRWRLGDTVLDTGIRADDKSLYTDWIAAIGAPDTDHAGSTGELTEHPTTNGHPGE